MTTTTATEEVVNILLGKGAGGGDASSDVSRILAALQIRAYDLEGQTNGDVIYEALEIGLTARCDLDRAARLSRDIIEGSA